MKKKKVLITGGTGFAGSHLAQLILNDEAVELHLTHIGPVSQSLRQLLGEKVIYHKVDLTDLEATRELIKKIVPDQIYQLASVATVGSSHLDPAKVLNFNQAIILNVLESIKECSPLAHVLIISSAEVYGACKPEELPISEKNPLQPANIYGVSKVSQDLLAQVYARSFNLRIIIARPFNHIGERQELGFVVSDFAHQVALIEKGRASYLSVGNLEARRDFCDVKDIVAGYQLLMEKGQVGEVYNLGSGQAVTMSEVVNQLAQLATVDFTVKVDRSRLRPSDIPEMRADCSKAQQLGWQQHSTMQKALERTLNYWRQNL